MSLRAIYRNDLTFLECAKEKLLFFNKAKKTEPKLECGEIIVVCYLTALDSYANNIDISKKVYTTIIFSNTLNPHQKGQTHETCSIQSRVELYMLL